MSEKQIERIVSGATRLFLERGVKAVRMDDIASELGVSKRTIYQLFENRETLLVECARQIHRQKVQSQQQRLDSDQRHNVIEDFIGLLENWESVMAYSLNFVNDLRRYYPDVFKRINDEINQDQFEGLKTALKSGVDDGIFFPNVNLDIMATMFIMWVDALFSSNAKYEKINTSLHEALKYMLICFFRGISTEKGVRQIDETFHRHFPNESLYR